VIPMAGYPNALAVNVPDEDSFWKAGAIYYERNDGRVLVPERLVVSCTVNLPDRCPG